MLLLLLLLLLAMQGQLTTKGFYLFGGVRHNIIRCDTSKNTLSLAGDNYCFFLFFGRGANVTTTSDTSFNQQDFGFVWCVKIIIIL